MIFYRAVPPPRKYFRHNGSAILAVVMILAVISSLIGLSSAKMTQAAMNGSTSHASTLQASAIAATDLDLLRSIEYKDLASSAKAAVPDSPYFHEIIVSNESSYSDTINQKTATVKVYKGSEAIPRAEVRLTRYSVESKPSGLPIGTIIAWASAKNPTDGTWLDCNGQSCAGYAELVSILGKSTVPDYRNRFLEGSATPGTIMEAGHLILQVRFRVLRDSIILFPMGHLLLPAPTMMMPTWEPVSGGILTFRSTLPIPILFTVNLPPSSPLRLRCDG